MTQQSGKVLVVGAGVTGAALSHLLQDATVAFKHVPEVVVWEKNNIAGGRMMARCACCFVSGGWFRALHSPRPVSFSICWRIQVVSQEPRSACGHWCAVPDKVYCCER